MVDFIVLSMKLVFMFLGVSTFHIHGFLLSDPQVAAQLVYCYDNYMYYNELCCDDNNGDKEDYGSCLLH